MKYSNFYIIKKNGSRIFRSAHIMQQQYDKVKDEDIAEKVEREE